MLSEKVIDVDFTTKKVSEAFEKGFSEAQELLKDEDKIERLLQRAENKIKSIPAVGEQLSIVPTFISLVRSYIRKEYQDLPIGTIIAIVSALIYIVSPVDLIPDFLPGVGHLDDAAMVVACLKLVNSDVEEYVNWRNKVGKTIKI